LRFLPIAKWTLTEWNSIPKIEQLERLTGASAGARVRTIGAVPALPVGCARAVTQFGREEIQ
jgi:hypothetical protein